MQITLYKLQCLKCMLRKNIIKKNHLTPPPLKSSLVDNYRLESQAYRKPYIKGTVNNMFFYLKIDIFQLQKKTIIFLTVSQTKISML